MTDFDFSVDFSEEPTVVDAVSRSTMRALLDACESGDAVAVADACMQLTDEDIEFLYSSPDDVAANMRALEDFTFDLLWPLSRLASMTRGVR